MYCKSWTNYKRFASKCVKIGDLAIGGSEKIKVQTMTNTNTQDTNATIEQIISSTKVGADLVRLTVPTIKSIKSLSIIHSAIRQTDNKTPLIADVHFSSQVAVASAEVVEKVRINPGNFVKSKKTFYTSEAYQEELNKTAEICEPLIDTCKRHDTAIRIGTNHGSLSQRIIGKYGNTVEGLVQATIEYIQIFVKNNFEKIVISVKSSNPTVMIQANRLLVAQMKEKSLNYPIHLGVTEAGNQRDGRIKSAIGIGALLIDGIGDTIRVSLSEKPENEIPVARQIVEYTSSRSLQDFIPEINTIFFNPYSFQRRLSYNIDNIGGSKPPVVIADTSAKQFNFGDHKPDYIYVNNIKSSEISQIIKFSEWIDTSKALPLLSYSEYLSFTENTALVFVKLNYKQIDDELLTKINKNKNVVIITENITNNIVGELRLFYSILSANHSEAPVILNLQYSETDFEKLLIKSSIDASNFLIDGLADGLWLSETTNQNKISDIVDSIFDILQASGRRLSKTEFISCPSCGRTLFDIETVIDKVKNKTKHLKGLKIAIMGCIVNGPGEVADADYGYIGAGSNKVTLFKGNKPVKKNINEDIAVEELINLIKENGDWVDIENNL